MSPYLPTAAELFEELELLSWLEQDRATPIALVRKPGAARPCVAKALFPEIKQDERALSRFCNEIYLHSQIRHRNVVRSIEYIRGASFLGFTMEYLSGGTLAGLIERKGAFSVREALAVILDIASGLKAIHDAGFVHCDVKPENILLSASGRAKIADLGIAQPNFFGSDDSRAVAGSLEYMSPEQLSIGTCDARSDVYSLGLIAFELLSGHQPFDVSDPKESLRRRLNQDAPTVSAIAPSVPSWLDRLIASMLSRSVELRPQSMGEVIHVIRRGRALQRARTASGRLLA